MSDSAISPQDLRIRHALAMAVQDLSPESEMGQRICASLNQAIHVVSGEIGYKPGVLSICFQAARNGFSSSTIESLFHASQQNFGSTMMEMVRTRLQQAASDLGASGDTKAARNTIDAALAFSQAILPLRNDNTDNGATLAGRLNTLKYVIGL